MAWILDSIKKIEKEKPEITIISFDLFDTILFRMVKEPVDVFYKVGEKAIQAGILPSHITPEIYKNIRIEAEKRARQIKLKKEYHTEVTLKEILECIPKTICKEKEHLLTFELETEQELCYISPDMEEVFSFLKEWKKKGKKLILTSDMYLSAEQERNLLESNYIDTKLFDFIFVSSECFCTKAEGSLYTYIIEKLQLKPENLLHIGDNYMADIVNAQYLGILTLQYDILHTNYMSFQIEEMKYGKIAPEIVSLRKYVSKKSEDLQQEFSLWFQIGAAILGPLMTDITEWILEEAEKEKIFTIYPLMREGKIFSELLQQAAMYRKEKFYIEPLYISRKAVFLPSIKEYNSFFIDQILLERTGTVKELFDLFQISVKGQEWEQFLLEDIRQFRSNCHKKGSIEEKIYHFLCKKETIETVNLSILESRKNILTYLKENLKLNRQYITVDIGYQGTIQKGLETLLKIGTSESYHGIHFLGFGTRNCIEKIFENIDIREYISMYGNEEKIANTIFRNAYLLEQLLMASCGTTIGYKNGIPILEKTEIDKRQNLWVAQCQLGILEYQKKFLYLKYVLKKKELFHQKRQELANIFVRMLSYPVVEEGRILSQLSYDKNFGSNQVQKLCPQDFMEKITKYGVTKFLDTITSEQVRWPEGLIVQAEPGYYIDKLLDQDTSLYEKAALKVIQKVRKEKVSKVVIVGAGMAGRLLQQYLRIYGICIEAFTDNNPKLHGTMIEQVPVKTLKDSFQTKAFVIGSFAFTEELIKQVKEQQGEMVRIFASSS